MTFYRIVPGIASHGTHWLLSGEQRWTGECFFKAGCGLDVHGHLAISHDYEGVDCLGCRAELAAHKLRQQAAREAVCDALDKGDK